ncbi:hypothetical protein Amn_pb00720 (plasmid) [Aminobacter sp. Y103A]|nr:hypothetical protein Amn_pb00720 [Aminobacter sp. SS-2016]
MDMQVLDVGREISGGYKVDVSRSERIGRVSSEWFSRPDDERYLSLSELADSVRRRSERSRSRVVETALIHVEAAGRNLFPCFPQVDADAMVWLHSPHGCHGQPTCSSVLG